MRELNTKLLIIGAGPGGYVAAIYAAKKGLEVTLVDSGSIGGTCLNWGCIPTKALVKSAELYQEILEGEKYGVFVEEAKIDLAKVIERKDEVREKLVSGIEFLLQKYNVNIIKGYAKFISDKQVLVKAEEDITLNCDKIIIATGSVTKHLPISGIDIPMVIDSKTLLDNKKLPKTLNVIGGGIIGMEFAFIYASMGVKVNVIEFLPRILPGIDRELGMRLLRYAKKLNIDIYTDSAVKKIEALGENAVVYFERKGKEQMLEADLVLEAVGRKPNVNKLGLENTSIVFDEKNGIKVNDLMETNVSGIYAIGDVTNIIQLAHVASHQGIDAAYGMGKLSIVLSPTSDRIERATSRPELHPAQGIVGKRVLTTLAELVERHSCSILSSSTPAAYAPPTSAPMLVPTTTSGSMPFSERTLSTPT